MGALSFKTEEKKQEWPKRLRKNEIYDTFISSWWLNKSLKPNGYLKGLSGSGKRLGLVTKFKRSNRSSAHYLSSFKSPFDLENALKLKRWFNIPLMAFNMHINIVNIDQEASEMPRGEKTPHYAYQSWIFFRLGLTNFAWFTAQSELFKFFSKTALITLWNQNYVQMKIK